MYADDPEAENPTLEGYIRASESTQKIEAIANQLRLGLGLGGAVTIILVSISSIYLTQEALSPMKKGVKQLKKLTNDVSHQVRTPLTRISIATEILLSQRDKIQPDQVRKLNIINAAVEQIKRRVRASSLVLVGNLSEQFEPIARDRRINFQIQLSDDVWVRGDSARLTRLFTSLLENAFNYTEPGGSVFFSMRLSQENVIISVRDTGVGIAVEHLPLIFQSFWRSDLAKIKYPEGLGLGLTIAQATVQQHRGAMTVSSQIGGGSYFQVRLPVV